MANIDFLNEGWADDDNKRYRGKLDRICVSRTEDWEVDYFIKDFIETYGYSKTSANRHLIAVDIDRYDGPVPVMRADITDWLLKRYNKKK
ncbi:hypothetical protein GCM10023185_33350 [Hymenobacter saemangeumensis]|uniref:Uncharacterized protein n=1 Tax=Hymenobacter saemangeumensis TaxID=1084522 RepID=A0ABP8INT8_9BACT